VSSSSDLRASKRALRDQVRALRDALPAHERVRRSEEISRRLFSIEAVAEAATVMAFSSFASEVETKPIIERLVREGRRVALPRVESGEIVAARYRPGEPVRTATFGASEPTGAEILAPEEIDVVVTPGLAFDRRGRRVGYGRGFYDRFLARTGTTTARIGICFSVQLVGDVPYGETDLAVDIVVTEDEVVRCR